MACKAFWKILTDAAFAGRAEPLFVPPRTGPDLRILALLQRDGRLVDFLLEDIDAYTDAQVGAAARDIHRGCRKALLEYVNVDPILDQPEDSPVAVPADFDPATLRLSGNLAGTGPYRGTLKHHGWLVRTVQLPELPKARDQSIILAPAEVEVA
jgi:hypothetical protein